jgi:NDP-sugar pyrophosphorylase family protein
MLHLIIPMAGKGKRFSDAGYSKPKPFVDVNGQPMISRVLNNMPRVDVVWFICLEDHAPYLEQMSLDYDFEQSTLYPDPPKSVRMSIDAVTEGAACTVQLALKEIPLDDEVIIANSDQWLDWSPEHFLDYVRREGVDGAIPTFHAQHPKWSFAHVQEDGKITGVVEKIPVSNHATCGVYYYRHCIDILNAIDAMVSKNIRTNGEFYLAPAYNEMILSGKYIANYPVPKMYGMGTPEDLEETLDSGVFG